MAELVEQGDSLLLTLNRWERFGAFKRRDIVMPISTLALARWSGDLANELRGSRVPGIAIPKKIYLGTWRHHNDKDFIAIYGSQPGYVIDLVEHDFARVVVSAPRLERLDNLAG